MAGLDFSDIVQQFGGTVPQQPAQPAVADPTAAPQPEPAPAVEPVEPVASTPAPAAATATAAAAEPSAQPSGNLDFSDIAQQFGGSTQPADAQQTESTDGNEGRGSMLPFTIGKDQGTAGVLKAVVEEAKDNPLFWLNPLSVIGPALKARGIEFALPSMIKEPIEANKRGLENQYPNTPEGQRQRAADALTAASGMLGAEAPAAKPAAEAVAAPAVAKTAKDVALEAADRIGVDVPRAATSGRSVGAVAAHLKEVPFVGTPIVKAGENAAAKMEGVVTKTAADMGGASNVTAGHALRNDIVKWLKDGSEAEASDLFAPVVKVLGSTKGQLENTATAVSALAERAAGAGTKPNKLIDDMNYAVNVAHEYGMTFENMQDLRQEVGKRLSGEIVPEPGLDKGALKTFYGALTRDIDELVSSAGTEAKNAWASANDRFMKTVQNRREILGDLVGGDGKIAPEELVKSLNSMANAKAGADIDSLRQVQATVSKETWQSFGSSVLEQLGRDKEGFSLAKFRTEWHKLSDDAKTAMLSPAHKQALDDVFTVGKQFTDLEKLGNPSRSGIYGTITATAAMLTANPLLVAKTAIGGRALAHVLAEPAGARAVSTWAKAVRAVTTTPSKATFNALAKAEQSFADAAARAGVPKDALLKAGLLVEATGEEDDNTVPASVAEQIGPDGA